MLYEMREARVLYGADGKPKQALIVGEACPTCGRVVKSTRASYMRAWRAKRKEAADVPQA